MNRSLKKELKREEAIERQLEREARTDEEQLRRLELNGFGRCKEAQRLRDRIAAR